MKSVIQSVLYEHGSSRKKALTRDYNEKENCRVNPTLREKRTTRLNLKRFKSFNEPHQ